jgi:hypothetical protein
MGERNMIKNLIIFLLVACLTFGVGINAFAADNIIVDFESNQEVSTDGFSGYIDIYRPDYLNTDTYQAKDNLQFNLDYGYRDRHRPRHYHHDGPGYYRPFGPRLWVYALVGVLFLDILLTDDFE